MTDFPLHTADTAPEPARKTLETVRQNMGFVPNLFGKMAEAPTTLDAYTTLSGLFDQTSLSPVEREVVLLVVSVENRCHFCVAAHSGRAKKAGMDAAALEALRAGGPLPDERLEALAIFTRAMLNKRGWVEEADVEAFIGAGFTRQQVLEVILGLSMKTLSNYINHVAGTPLNDELESLRWDGPA